MELNSASLTLKFSGEELFDSIKHSFDKYSEKVIDLYSLIHC